MSTTTDRLPAPAKAHATCAWCRRRLETIVALLDHVDTEHLTSA